MLDPKIDSTKVVSYFTDQVVGRVGAREKNSQMCDTFFRKLRIKLAQIRNFSILNDFPKWASHF